jgi:hypothetical protein
MMHVAQHQHHQQQQQQQHMHQQFQQDSMLRSWSPRRSSHHSWSGAPRSLPAAAAAPAAAAGTAAGGGPMEFPSGVGGCAAWDLQLQGLAAVVADVAAGRYDNMPGAVAEGVTGVTADAAAGVPFRRVSHPRISNHGHFLEPQQLTARASKWPWLAEVSCRFGAACFVCFASTSALASKWGWPEEQASCWLVAETVCTVSPCAAAQSQGQLPQAPISCHRTCIV